MTTSRASAGTATASPEKLPYKVTTIRPSQLSVDHTVQRAQDRIRVAAIANDYKPKGLGVIHVSRRSDGTHHIIDGQHRIAALRTLGREEEPVPCAIYEGLTRGEEAALFRLLNNTRKVQPLDRFLVRMVEGDPAACELARILAEHGWTIAKSSARGAFFAVTALEKVYRAGGDPDPATCEAVIRVATEAWGHDSNAVRAEIVAGLGVLLRRYPHLEMPKLVAELAKHEGGPLGLIGKARQLRDIRAGRMADSMAEIFVNQYNKRRHASRLPNWNAA